MRKHRRNMNISYLYSDHGHFIIFSRVFLYFNRQEYHPDAF